MKLEVLLPLSESSTSLARGTLYSRFTIRSISIPLDGCKLELRVLSADAALFGQSVVGFNWALAVSTPSDSSTRWTSHGVCEHASIKSVCRLLHNFAAQHARLQGKTKLLIQLVGESNPISSPRKRHLPHHVQCTMHGRSVDAYSTACET